jgi:hypothetical protein
VGVEDALGVEDVLDLAEVAVNFLAIGPLEPGAADGAVVVFAGEDAVVFEHELVGLLHGGAEFLALVQVFELHERDDVEVAVAHVAGDGGEQVVFFDDCAFAAGIRAGIRG